ncbi:Histone transcription regulator 3 [Kalmusia sp. IMI 367209]|nr:Histone transcription regulator 3 [Kalmusia sp. IMI 367209]
MKTTWHALNVESDNEEEDEVDDTKEIQIEEALKLYQTALKYHAEGPQSFEKTAEAYKALFDSEIFKYNESLSEYKRHELFGEDLVFDNILQDDYDAGPVQATGGNESAPNTLPQILHLSYKNHGQFILETMQHWISQHGVVAQQQGSGHIATALSCFAEALDKEDTDLDLWLRTASVAAMLGSPRITRFCLEAVLDGNDELYDSLLRLPGLEEGFAGHQLRELVTKLEDTLSLQQPSLSMSKKKLSETLKKRLNPYPFAPLPAEVPAPGPSQADARPPRRVLLNPPKWDWAGIGDAILRYYIQEQSGLTETDYPGSGISFNLPPEANILEAAESASAEEENSAQEPPKEDSPLEKENLPDSLRETNASAVKDGEDVVMEDPDTNADAKVNEGNSVTPGESTQEQSRKRSTDSAGLPETAEGGRSRSKRLRAREATDPSANVEVVGQDIVNKLEDQLWPFVHADQCLCEVVNDIFMRLGVEGLGSPKQLRNLVTDSSSVSTTDNIDRAAYDMYTALQTSGAKIAPVLLSPEPMDLGNQSREAGLNAFLGYSKSSTAQACAKSTLQSEQLASFVLRINDGWLSTHEVAFSWAEALLSPGFIVKTNNSDNSAKSSYMQYRWAEDLKRTLIQTLVNVDEFIYTRMLDRLERLNAKILEVKEKYRPYEFSSSDAADIEMIETIFELHLDVYSLIKHPNSGVDQVTQTLQSDRLSRWVSLAREGMQLRSSYQSNIELEDELSLRHIWASVFQLSVSEDVLPQHVLYAMEELKAIFQSLDDRIIEVQNNAVMPELSVTAVDRELVRISMKDFFLKVFDTDEKDPVAVIESLEPILEPLQETDRAIDEEVSGKGDSHTDPSSFSTIENVESDMQVSRPSPVQEMRKFLDSASVSLRLSLWQRLREAYEAIEYPPKVLSCYLRSIETMIGKVNTSTYQETPTPERHVDLAQILRIVDEVVVNVLQIIRNEKDAFACLSYEHMQSSMSAISQLLRVMSASNFLQDMIRVGQLSAPRIEAFPPATFVNITSRLNDIQVRLWILQYHLLKEGIAQTSKDFPIPSDEEFEFLRHVHHALGVRACGHSAGRVFLRLAKDEILRLDDVSEASNRDTELSQILYDLYGLKTFINPQECQEFGSNPDILDKKTATNLLPFILSQAGKISIKDLPKHELKTTIERVHGALGRPRSHEEVSQNRKTISAFIKSPINPVSLFNCLKGIGTLPTKPIPTEVSIPAAKGWYFLMGNIALNKFKSQKRTTQAPTEDVNFAQAFFVQDLEFSIERWETWYRLAQAYDIQLEEAVSWNADKMNNNSMELLAYQRSSIHCYTMAVACALRDADSTSQTRAKVAQLYTDFGNRMYASSREPFSMNAFNIKDSEHKFFSGSGNMVLYQNLPFAPLQPYTAWKFANVLFKRAVKGDPDKWWNHYMLAKCLWKMYCFNAEERIALATESVSPSTETGPTWEEVLAAIRNAIETLPEKRERGREPILEPHYKLVAVTHKLFQRRVIDHKKGEEILQHTHFSHNLGSPEDADHWEGYILSVLKALRTADKSSWHHRIIARAAHVIYDESNDLMVAQGAKHELTQQIFTKTMAVQVWKPENERPGRHFVYTTRYTRFFIHLLDQTGDQPNLEALARRVRRKQTDFFEHTKLWQELCSRYLQLLRRIGHVSEGQEDTVFRALNYEEYNIQATRLEAWCQDPTTQHPALDALRHVVELKRVNNGLMKAVPIDDLLGDTFALLYATVGPTLPPLPSEQKQLPTLQAAPDPSTQAVGAPFMSSITQGQVDGTNDTQNGPFNHFHPSQLQAPPPEPAPKPRAKTVGRREIQRRAESCGQKPAGAPPPPTTVMAIRSPPAAAPAILPSNLQPTLEINTKPTPNASPPVAGSNTAPPRRPTPAVPPVGLQRPQLVAPASVRDDDADDESELSELDESEVQEIGEKVEQSAHSAAARASLFPNLKINRVASNEVTEGSTEGEDEEEEDEEDEEEDDDVKGEDVEMKD